MKKSVEIVAFTLIEILVVVWILWILAFWYSNIDFSRISQKQEVAIETLKIKSILEEVKQNALLWRALGSSPVTPKAWKIEFSRIWSGSLNVYYTNNGTNWLNYNDINWQLKQGFSIKSIVCKNVQGGSSANLSNTWVLSFTGSSISLWETGTNCSNSDTYKIVEITQGNLLLSETIRFNSVTWVLETY